jgi:DNA-binding GntR family transcriptional regulator
MMKKLASQDKIIERPRPIRKQVYEHLRNQILNRTIAPSSRLVEAQIAKELGISRTPVREALHLLEKDRFVESIPRVGYRVKQLAWSELDEIFEIRTVNELLACRWALEKIDAAGIRALEKNVNLTERAVEAGHPESFLDLDQEFHEILVGASGSHYLVELCQQLRRLMLRYRIESIKSDDTAIGGMKGHRQIIECLKKRDREGLEAAMVAHLEYARENIRERALEHREQN